MSNSDAHTDPHQGQPLHDAALASTDVAAQGPTTPVLQDSLGLDRRARAILKAMGIQWFWPASPQAQPAQAPHPAPVPTPASSVQPPHQAPHPLPDAPEPPVAAPRSAPQHSAVARVERAKPSTAAPSTAPQPASPAAVRAPVDVSNTSWAELPSDIAACTSCGLCDGATARIAGWGNPQATWLFVVESLSAADQGEQPINGDEWDLLQAIWRAMKLTPEQVYVTSVSKCRALPGVAGTASDAQQCVAYVKRQIELLQPHMVVAMGQPVAQALLPESAQQFKALGQWRTQLHQYAAGHAHSTMPATTQETTQETTQATTQAIAQTTPVVVTYPLAAMLRTPAEKGKTWADLCMALVHVQAHAPTVPAPTVAVQVAAHQQPGSD
jgi:uracil-DNA glycosylase